VLLLSTENPKVDVVDDAVNDPVRVVISPLVPDNPSNVVPPNPVPSYTLISPLLPAEFTVPFTVYLFPASVVIA